MSSTGEDQLQPNKNTSAETELDLGVSNPNLTLDAKLEAPIAFDSSAKPSKWDNSKLIDRPSNSYVPFNPHTQFWDGSEEAAFNAYSPSITNNYSYSSNDFSMATNFGKLSLHDSSSLPGYYPSLSANQLGATASTAPSGFSSIERGYPTSTMEQPYYVDPSMHHIKQSFLSKPNSIGCQYDGTSYFDPDYGFGEMNSLSTAGGRERNSFYWDSYGKKHEASSKNTIFNVPQKFGKNLGTSNKHISTEGHTSFSNGKMFSDLAIDQMTGKWSERNDLKLFRGYKQKKGSIDANIYEVGQDKKNRNRFLQGQKLVRTPGNLEKLSAELGGQFVDFMTSESNNYLIQEFIDACTPNQLTQMLYEITKNDAGFLRVCCGQHGHRCMRKAIQALHLPQQFSIISRALQPHIVDLMRDPYGYQVAQACLDAQFMPVEYCQFIFSNVPNSCAELAINRYGCRVLPYYIRIVVGEDRRNLMNQLISESLNLCEDAYGNYIVQNIINNDVIAANAIINKFMGKFCDLSMKANASHVVETCLSAPGKTQILDIVVDMTRSPLFKAVLVNQFGNFVAQTALKVTKGTPIYDVLLEAIQPHYYHLRADRYGKKVLERIVRIKEEIEWERRNLR